MSRLVDVVGEFLRRIEADRLTLGARSAAELIPEMRNAWNDERTQQDSLPALAEAACRKAIERGQSSEALNFHALMMQMRQSGPEVANG